MLSVNKEGLCSDNVDTHADKRFSFLHRPEHPFNAACSNVFMIVRPVGSFKWSGPSCSKLTTSLVNDSLKFTSSDMQIC